MRDKIEVAGDNDRMWRGVQVVLISLMQYKYTVHFKLDFQHFTDLSSMVTPLNFVFTS